MMNTAHVSDGDRPAAGKPLVPAGEAEPLTVTVREAARLTGLCKSTIHNLISAKKLAATKVGTRRLVVYSSLKKLLGLSGAA
jgi:excisionase family DNA binding protein